jgi:Glyoxalase-like domain
MLTGIDHLVIAVRDPDSAVRALTESTGLVAGGGGRHEALGTYNRIIWLGDAYLELIGVFDPDLADRSWVGRPVRDILSTGEGLATWAIGTDDIDADVTRLASSGSAIGRPIAGKRVRPDGEAVSWRLAAGPNLAPDAPPFLIQHDPDGAEWRPADRAARSTVPGRLTALEMAVDDVAAATLRLLRTLDLHFRPSLQGGGARDTSIGDQILRIRPRRDPGPAATIRVSIPGRPSRQTDLLGCRWVIGS